MDPSNRNTTMAASNSLLSNNSSVNWGSKSPYFFLVIFIIVFIVCFCNSPWCRRLRGERDQLPQLPQQAGQVTTASDIETGLSRLEFVKSNLPYRIVEAGDKEISDISPSNSRSTRSLQKKSYSGSSGLGSGIDDKMTNMHSSNRSLPSHDAMDDVETSSKIRPTLRSSLASQTSSSPIHVCSICLGSYRAGDEVAYSTNPSCPHEYHRDCIHDWLLRHEDCPLCRNVFLPKDLSATPSQSSGSSATNSTEHEEEPNHSTQIDQTRPPVTSASS